jgi:hypothetical protein
MASSGCVTCLESRQITVKAKLLHDYTHLELHGGIKHFILLYFFYNFPPPKTPFFSLFLLQNFHFPNLNAGFDSIRAWD